MSRIEFREGKWVQVAVPPEKAGPIHIRMTDAGIITADILIDGLESCTCGRLFYATDGVPACAACRTGEDVIEAKQRFTAFPGRQVSIENDPWAKA